MSQVLGMIVFNRSCITQTINRGDPDRVQACPDAYAAASRSPIT
jgi:hypothetical protein